MNARPVDVARDLLGNSVLCMAPWRGSLSRPKLIWAATIWRRTPPRALRDRTRVIFGPPGHAYVYLSYGMHDCLNIVAEPRRHARLRADPRARTCGGPRNHALPPAARPDRARPDLGARQTDAGAGYHSPEQRCGHDAWRSCRAGRPLVLQEFDITVTPRIGITKCADLPLRFLITGNPFVSR